MIPPYSTKQEKVLQTTSYLWLSKFNSFFCGNQLFAYHYIFLYRFLQMTVFWLFEYWNKKPSKYFLSPLAHGCPLWHTCRGTNLKWLKSTVRTSLVALLNEARLVKVQYKRYQKQTSMLLIGWKVRQILGVDRNSENDQRRGLYRSTFGKMRKLTPNFWNFRTFLELQSCATWRSKEKQRQTHFRNETQKVSKAFSVWLVQFSNPINLIYE